MLSQQDPKNPTWGSHGIAVEDCTYPCSPDSAFTNIRVWVDDFTNHTVTAFTADGDKLLQMGTPGIAGNGTHPTLQFGNVADSAIATSPRIYQEPTYIYSSDGDGGSANRVTKASPSFACPVALTDFLSIRPHPRSQSTS